MAKWFYLLVILLLALLGIKALFHSGLFTAHDIWHQVVRFHYYTQAINDGQFPPYWIGQLANFFGYPLFLFSYHLPWIIGIPLIKIGFNLEESIRILFILSFVLSGFTMYFFALNLLKDKLAATLSSILYLWMPYHFLVIYVSGSIGIAFVFTFLPLLLLGINLSSEKTRLGPILLTLGLMGIILSHVMHLLFLLPLIVTFTVWKIFTTAERSRLIRNLFIGGILAVLVSSFYLLPAIYYNQFTRVHQEEGITKLYERNFIDFKQLIYSKWGYSPIVNNAKNGEISFQLGIVQWLSFILLLLLFIFRKVTGTHKSLSTYLIICLVINIFLMLDYSKSIWKEVLRLVSLDFPFRFLLPATFIATIFSGIILVSVSKRIRIVVFISLTALALYTNRNHINVNQYTYFPISTYLSLPTEITTSTFNEYLPIQADPSLLNKPWNEIIGEQLIVTNVHQTTAQLTFDVKSSKSQKVSLGQFYFPGQNLYIDNMPHGIEVDKKGRMSFTLEGNHNIKVVYQTPHLILFSKILTIAGFAVVFFYIWEILKNLKKKTYS